MKLQPTPQRPAATNRGGLVPTSDFRLPHSQRAFTIIEVLVATFILSLVLVSLYGSWQIIVRSTDRALQLTVDAQRARMAARTVEEALSSAMLFQANAPLYAFVADTSGEFSAVSFAGNLSESFPGSGYFGGERLRRVTFMVESGEEGPELRLYQNSLLAPPDADVAAIPTVLARNVTAFQLEFWDTRSGEYATEWLLTNQLPQLVRITLGFGATGRNGQQPREIVTRTALISSTAVPATISGAGNLNNQGPGAGANQGPGAGAVSGDAPPGGALPPGGRRP